MPRINLFQNWTYRVTAIYVGLFALSVLTLLGFIYGVTISLIDRQINATVLADINGLSERYREHGLDGLVELIGERLANDHAGDGIYFLADSSYQPVAGNLPRWPTQGERQDRWATYELQRRMPGASEEGEDSGDTVEARVMSFNLSEGYHLMVGRSLRERRNFEELILQSLFWSLFVTAGLAVLGGMVMSRDMRGRLEAINRTTHRIMADGDLKQRIPLAGTGDDFDRLSANLNAMLGEIDRLMAARREVSDNIAHDLRSPLTRLKSRLELVLLGQHSDADYRQAIDRAVSDTDNILGTFNALLSIAQAEAGAGRQDMAPLDLAQLAGDVGELYEPVAESRDIAFATYLPGQPVMVHGNRHLLFQAVANLVDNAIKYSPDGSSVSIAVRQQDGRPVLVVADSGPGIPAEERDHVLERFVRLDRSRSLPGNGLGLSLVQAVVGLHHGRIELGDNQPGLKVTLIL